MGKNRARRGAVRRVGTGPRGGEQVWQRQSARARSFGDGG
jgi:hypothetical protein